MPKFAANLTMLFQENPFLERFELAAKAGFQFVEYLFPYEYEAKQLKQQLNQHQLKQVLFNLPPGKWDQGERGIACHPDRTTEFNEGVERAITYAKTLNVKQINCLAGIKPAGISEAQAWQTLIENVQFAAQALSKHGILLLVEPINSKVDMPGFIIDTFEKAQALIHEVGHNNLKVQFDLYHMQIMQGDLIRTIKRNLKDIAHIQFADNPGRHEPGTGELNFANLFKQLDELGYPGYVSAEYLPSGNTSDSLCWLRTFN